jgi:protein gp37
MSSKSKIEWTDATWNPIRGCTKISPGCKHCYAERFAERFRGSPVILLNRDSICGLYPRSLLSR